MKTDKYTSGEMQNDIIQVMALEILRKVAASIRDAPFYTIMADETTDMSNREQVVLCIRWVTENFEVREEFIGLYVVEAKNAKTRILVIKDVLQRLNLSLKKPEDSAMTAQQLWLA